MVPRKDYCIPDSTFKFPGNFIDGCLGFSYCKNSINSIQNKGIELPFTISNHGVLKYDENTIFIIGGDQNGSVSNKTWIVNPKNEFEIKEGPKLNHKRSEFSYGKMRTNAGKLLLIVAGGYGETFGEILNTVEILDPTSDQGWIIGM